jgi:hypothetical protein
MNVARLVRRMLVPTLAVGTLLAGMTGTAAADRQTVFVVQLSGNQVVGNPGGDPDGIGTATITVDHKTEQVCLDVDTTNVATPTEDYVLGAGSAAEPAGSVEVIFNVDGNNPDPSTCAVIYVGFLSFKALWKTIEGNPEAFNLRVHNFEHADNGAIRGQLTLA